VQKEEAYTPRARLRRSVQVAGAGEATQTAGHVHQKGLLRLTAKRRNAKKDGIAGATRVNANVFNANFKCNQQRH
jgi:hypothetical protein